MLELRDVAAAYGAVEVLRGVALTARAGEVTCLMGRNGAGKTTILRTIMAEAGVTRTGGTIRLGDRPIQDLPPHLVPRQGIAVVPQGRRLFGAMSVRENLAIGLMTRPMGRDAEAAMMARVLELFPRLGERLDQRASTLSGGEQQMLAVGRAMCIDPSVILLDEPTEGLQPSMQLLIRDVVRRLADRGVAVVLVEQRQDAVLAVADRVVFVAGGRSVETCPVGDLHPGCDAFRRHVGI